MPVYVIDTLKPKNGLDFPVVEAIDVAVEGYSSLADAVTHFATQSAIDTINTALGTKANTSDVNTATASLQAQIDQIAQTAGTGTADTEIGQARVGADGTVYNTLKARLDDSDTTTDSKLTKATDYSTKLKELLDNSFQADTISVAYTATANRIIEPNGDITTTETSFTATDYIDIENYTFLNIGSASGYGKCYFAFYDSSYNFVSGEVSPAGAVTTFENAVAVPDTAKYIVVANPRYITGVIDYKAVSDDTIAATEAVKNNVTYSPSPLTIEITQNRVLKTTGEIVEYDNTSYTVAKIDISDIAILQITASANYSNALYVITDNEDNVLSYMKAEGGSAVTAIENHTIVVPENAKYCSAANVVSEDTPTIIIAEGIPGLVANDVTENLENQINDMIISGIPENVTNAANVVDDNSDYIDNDITLTIEQGYLLRNTGQYVEYAGHSEYTVAKTDVSNYRKLKITASANFSNALYVITDENDNVLTYEVAPGGSTIVEIIAKEITLPAGAKWCMAANIVTVARPSIVISYLTTGLIASALTEDLYQEIGTNHYKNKKWVVIGDSLTEHNIRTTMNYHDYIANATGITVVNMGVSGTGYKRGEDNSRAFYQRAANIPADADVITIFGSGNDMPIVAGGNLGEPTDTGTSTICGCINATIDTIIGIIPNASLGIVSPTPWESYHPTLDNSNIMEQYSEALRQICQYRSIPFLDLYHCSNLRPWTSEGREACYSKDDGNGVHPDEAGHKLIAPRFKSFLDNLIL